MNEPDAISPRLDEVCRLVRRVEEETSANADDSGFPNGESGQVNSPLSSTDHSDLFPLLETPYVLPAPGAPTRALQFYATPHRATVLKSEPNLPLPESLFGYQLRRSMEFPGYYDVVDMWAGDFSRYLAVTELQRSGEIDIALGGSYEPDSALVAWVRGQAIGLLAWRVKHLLQEPICRTDELGEACGRLEVLLTVAPQSIGNNAIGAYPDGDSKADEVDSDNDVTFDTTDDQIQRRRYLLGLPPATLRFLECLLDHRTELPPSLLSLIPDRGVLDILWPAASGNSCKQADTQSVSPLTAARTVAHALMHGRADARWVLDFAERAFARSSIHASAWPGTGAKWFDEEWPFSDLDRALAELRAPTAHTLRRLSSIAVLDRVLGKSRWWPQVRNFLYQHVFSWPLLTVKRLAVSVPVSVDVSLDDRNCVDILPVRGAAHVLKLDHLVAEGARREWESACVCRALSEVLQRWLQTGEIQHMPQTDTWILQDSLTDQSLSISGEKENQPVIRLPLCETKIRPSTLLQDVEDALRWLLQQHTRGLSSKQVLDGLKRCVGRSFADHVVGAASVGKVLWRSKHGGWGGSDYSAYRNKVMRAGILFDFTFADWILAMAGFSSFATKRGSADGYFAQVVLARILGKSPYLSSAVSIGVGDRRVDDNGNPRLDYRCGPVSDIDAKLKYVFLSEMFERIVLPLNKWSESAVSAVLAKGNRLISQTCEVYQAPYLSSLADIVQVHGWRQFEYVRCPDLQWAITAQHAFGTRPPGVVAPEDEKVQSALAVIRSNASGVVRMPENVGPAAVVSALWHLNSVIRVLGHEERKAPPSLSWTVIRAIPDETDTRFWDTFWRAIDGSADQFDRFRFAPTREQSVDLLVQVLNRFEPTETEPWARAPDFVVIVGYNQLDGDGSVTTANPLMKLRHTRRIVEELERRGLERTGCWLNPSPYWGSLKPHIGASRIILVTEIPQTATERTRSSAPTVRHQQPGVNALRHLRRMADALRSHPEKERPLEGLTLLRDSDVSDLPPPVYVAYRRVLSASGGSSHEQFRSAVSGLRKALDAPPVSEDEWDILESVSIFRWGFTQAMAAMALEQLAIGVERRARESLQKILTTLVNKGVLHFGQGIYDIPATLRSTTAVKSDGDKSLLARRSLAAAYALAPYLAERRTPALAFDLCFRPWQVHEVSQLLRDCFDLASSLNHQLMSEASRRLGYLSCFFELHSWKVLLRLASSKQFHEARVEIAESLVTENGRHHAPVHPINLTNVAEQHADYAAEIAKRVLCQPSFPKLEDAYRLVAVHYAQACKYHELALRHCAGGTPLRDLAPVEWAAEAEFNTLECSSRYARFLYELPYGLANETRFEGALSRSVSLLLKRARAGEFSFPKGEFLEMLGDLEPDHAISANRYAMDGIGPVWNYWTQLRIKGIGAMALAGREKEIESLLTGLDPPAVKKLITKAVRTGDLGLRGVLLRERRQREVIKTLCAVAETARTGNRDTLDTSFRGGLASWAQLSILPEGRRRFYVRESLLPVLQEIEAGERWNANYALLQDGLAEYRKALDDWRAIVFPRWVAGVRMICSRFLGHLPGDVEQMLQ